MSPSYILNACVSIAYTPFCGVEGVVQLFLNGYTWLRARFARKGETKNRGCTLPSKLSHYKIDYSLKAL